MRIQVRTQGMEAETGEVDAGDRVPKWSSRDHRNWYAESCDDQDDNKAIARLGEDCVPRKTQYSTYDEGTCFHGIAFPEAMRNQCRKVELKTIDQTYDIKRRVQHLGKIKKDANRATEFRAERSRDQVVGTAALDLTIASYC